MTRPWLWIAFVTFTLIPGAAAALDKGQAYAQVMASAQASYNAMIPTFQAQRKVCAWFSNTAASGIAYGAVVSNTANCGGVGNATAWGTTYTLAQANYTGSCSAREASPGGTGKMFVASASLSGVCFDGCFYTMGQESTRYKLGAATKSVLTSTGLTPDGSVCADLSSPSSDDQCVADGTLTQCVKADGSHCTRASTGAQFCWGKTEAGVKVATNGNEAATKSPEGAGINAPRTPPKNGGDWQVTGQSSTSITNNNTTTNYNTTNFQSTYGPSGSGGGSGGSGDGGTGGDDGGDDDGNDPGGVGEGAGDFYTGSDLTVGGLLGDYYAKVTNTPLLGSVRSFLLVNGGGSCPVFTMPATAWTPTLTFDAHCTGTLYGALQAMGWVLLGIVSYFAVRISVT